MSNGIDDRDGGSSATHTAPRKIVMNRDDVIRDLQARYRQARGGLNERQRRLWAGAEAVKLGRGGKTLVSHALRMSPNTIKRGIQELASAPADANARIRKSGGGRKPRATDRRNRTQPGKEAPGMLPGPLAVANPDEPPQDSPPGVATTPSHEAARIEAPGQAGLS